MIDPMVTPDVALIGAGTWFANKIFGPSADLLGQSIRDYGTDRIRKIFGRAAEKVIENKISPLPPGYMMTFMEKASFSEDEENITEMWASLLANSAQGYTSRMTAYVDILSQMTSHDAEVISDLVPKEFSFSPAGSRAVNLKIEMINNLLRIISVELNAEDECRRVLVELLNMDFAWPAKIMSARLIWAQSGEVFPMSGGNPDSFASRDNLCRLGLLERFDLTTSLAPFSTAVEGFIVTALGVGFIQTCRNVL
jgi:hypothetical protein